MQSCIIHSGLPSNGLCTCIVLLLIFLHSGGQMSMAIRWHEKKPLSFDVTRKTTWVMKSALEELIFAWSCSELTKFQKCHVISTYASCYDHTGSWIERTAIVSMRKSPAFFNLWCRRALGRTTFANAIFMLIVSISGSPFLQSRWSNHSRARAHAQLPFSLCVFLRMHNCAFTGEPR